MTHSSSNVAPLAVSRDVPEYKPFGQIFGPHMTTATFADDQWSAVSVGELAPLVLHPGTHALHYASQGFEGMKAYRQPDGSVAIFRLDDHVARFQGTAEGLELAVPPAALVRDLILKAVMANVDVVPAPPAALYLRPTIIGTDADIGAVTHPSKSVMIYVVVAPIERYFKSGHRLRVQIVDRERAVPGIGAVKAGANYASALKPMMEARRQSGVDQVLFCPGDDIQETGTSNFILLDEHMLWTKPLSPAFLPGITRASLLVLAKAAGLNVVEARISVADMLAFIRGGEAALTGTAAVIAPIGEIVVGREVHPVAEGAQALRLREALTNIQFGHAADEYGWMTRVSSG